MHQNNYFSHILAKDLLPILEDIKDAHKDDTETSDGGYTMDELEQIADAARNGGNKISSLIAVLSTALRIKRTPKNEDKLGGSEVIEHKLATFSSPKNPEIEDFIRNKAISFATGKLSMFFIP